MAEELNLDLKVTGFQSLKAQLKEAQAEAQRLAEQFGETSAQAIQAAGKVGKLRDEIGDAAARAKALGTLGGQFQTLTRSLSGVAGGFSAIQGAIGLAGGNAKEFEKTMAKVQSAMALTQGLTALADVGDAFNDMKVVAVNAFKAIKTAIGSTGIGLLVIALGTIVAYWDEISAAVSGVTEEQEALNEAAEQNVKAQDEALVALDLQENTLRLQGKSEREITQLKIQQTNEAIAASEVLLEQQQATKKAQVEAAQRNKDILQGIIRFIGAPITALLSAIDMVGKAFGKNFGLEEKFSGGIAKLVFDPAEVAKEGDAAIAETQNKLAKLKSSRDGLKLKIKEEDKKDRQTSQADADKAEQERLKKLKESYDAEIQANKNTYAEKIQAAKERGEDTFALEQELLQKQIAIQEQAKFKELGLEQEIFDGKMQLRQNDLANTEKVRADNLKKLEQSLEDEKNAATAAAEKANADRQLQLQQQLEKGLITEEEFATKSLEIAKQAALDKQALDAENYNKEIAFLDQALSQGLIKQEEYNRRRLAADQAYGKASIENQTAVSATTVAIQKKEQTDSQAIKDAKLAAELQFAQAVAGVLGNLSGLFKEGSKAQKIAALAEIAVNTAIGFIQGLDIAQKGAKATGPAAPFAFPIFYATQIAAVLGAAAKARDILKKSDSGGGQAEAGGSAPIQSRFAKGGLLTGRKHAEGGMMTPFGELEGGEFVVNRSATSAFLPLLNAINGTGQGSGAPNNMSSMAESSTPAPAPIIKTYVVATDVTSQQEANKRISDLARL